MHNTAAFEDYLFLFYAQVRILERVPNRNVYNTACCHQHSCAESAAFLIEEMVKRGISLNTKTVRGPGSFASGKFLEVED